MNRLPLTRFTVRWPALLARQAAAALARLLRQSMLAVIILLAMPAAAQGIRIDASQPELLHPRQAFVFAAHLADDVVRIDFSIEPGYYLYRKNFQFLDRQGETLPGAEFPPGQVIEDEFFGTVETYRNDFAIVLPVPAPEDDLQLLMISQGCADIGVCFPPEKVTLAFAAGGGVGRIVGDYSIPDFARSASSQVLSAAGIGDSGRAFAVLAEQPLAVALATFFLFGLLLSFTPCVLPMVPIVLAIVTGGRNPPGTGRAFALCTVYVVVMAIVYAALGIVAATSGQLLSYYLQHPAVVALLAALFALLGAAMLGLFDLQLLPAAAAGKIGRLRSAQGTWLGAAAFGATSAIVVSPCVAAPLVGALLFISQSGDSLLGGSALAALGLGMGMLPLAAAAGAAGALPRSGALAAAVRTLFALMMFAVAIWLLAALVAAPLRMAGYALLAAAAAVTMVRSARMIRSSSPGAGKVAALVGVVFGFGSMIMAVGAVTGASSEFSPLARLGSAQPVELEFVPVASSGEIDVRAGSSGGRITMVEFTAQWCAACRELEAHTFTDAQVSRQLAKMQLLRVDVTEIDAAGRDLLDRFGLFGPPAMIFIDATGRERGRVLGFQSASQFGESLVLIEQRVAGR